MRGSCLSEMSEIPHLRPGALTKVQLASMESSCFNFVYIDRFPFSEWYYYAVRRRDLTNVMLWNLGCGSWLIRFDNSQRVIMYSVFEVQSM